MLTVAHRGASGHAPENTLAAYDLALAMGADLLEYDIQMSADGVPVILHDESLDRTARGPDGLATGLAADRTLDELRRCEVGSWFHPRFAGEPLPTLEEVLRRYGSRPRLCLEIKPEAEGVGETLLGLLDRHRLRGRARERREILIQSFHPGELRAVHALDPRLALVQLFRTRVETEEVHTRLDAVSEYAVALGANLCRVDAGLVAAAHARGLAVHAFTVNEPAQIERALSLGVDAAITDYPDRVLARMNAEPSTQAA